MANRVTQAEVVAILEDVGSSTDLSAFITTANVLTTAVCTASSLSTVQRKEIERYLSAHFYKVMDSRLASEKIGDGTDKIVSKVSLGLDLTHYGQQAQMLDTSGALSALKNQKRPAVFRVLKPNPL